MRGTGEEMATPETDAAAAIFLRTTFAVTVFSAVGMRAQTRTRGAGTSLVQLPELPGNNWQQRLPFPDRHFVVAV